MTLIRKPSELQVQTTIKALIYGQPGIGKTTAALSSPNPVLLDFDNGVHRVNMVHQVPILQVSGYGDFLAVLNSGELNDYSTIVIDTAGKMLDYMGQYIIQNDPKLGKRDGSLSLQGYGARKGEFLRVLRAISIMGKHIVFVAHDREEKEGDMKVVRPEIGGSSANDLIKELDLVGYMQAIGQQRTISFEPCEKFYGKNACNLPPSMPVPVLLSGNGDNVSVVAPNSLLSDIFRTYQANLESRKPLVEKYHSLMEAINENVMQIQDIDSLNETRSRVAEWEHIWDSQVVAGTKLNAKARELNAKWNPTEKAYVASPASV